MTREEIRATVLRVLGDIAPEADLAALKPDVPFRDQLDLDSMDLLNVVVGLHAALGVDIPEADYPRLATLDACVEYLAQRSVGSASDGAPCQRGLGSSSDGAPYPRRTP